MRRGSEGVGSERDEGLVRRGMSLSLSLLLFTRSKGPYAQNVVHRHFICLKIQRKRTAISLFQDIFEKEKDVFNWPIRLGH